MRWCGVVNGRVRKNGTDQAELGPESGQTSAAQRNGLEVSNDGSEDLAVGIGFRHGDPDVADREADLGADLQELQANRLTLSASQGGLLQSETTQGVHEHVGGGGQIQPEIGAHRSANRSNCCSFTLHVAPAQ